MRPISPQAEDKFVSTAMRLIMQGREEGIEEGREKGREEGREEGIEKGIEKVAFSMLQENMPDALILKVTKLTPKQLVYLKTLKEYK